MNKNRRTLNFYAPIKPGTLNGCKHILKFSFIFMDVEKLFGANSNDKTKEKVPNEEKHHVLSNFEVWVLFFMRLLILIWCKTKLYKKKFAKQRHNKWKHFSSFSLMLKTNGIKLYEKGFLCNLTSIGVLLFFLFCVLVSAKLCTTGDNRYLITYSDPFLQQVNFLTLYHVIWLLKI